MEICDKFFWHVRSKFRTQKEAATHYGVTSAFISAVCRGKKLPNDQMTADLGYTKRKIYIGDTPEQLGFGMLVDGQVFNASDMVQLRRDARRWQAVRDGSYELLHNLSIAPAQYREQIIDEVSK